MSAWIYIITAIPLSLFWFAGLYVAFNPEQPNEEIFTDEPVVFDFTQF